MKYLHKSAASITVVVLAMTMLFSINFPESSVLAATNTTATPTDSTADESGIIVSSPVSGTSYELGDKVDIRWSNLTVHVRAADIAISLLPQLPACLTAVPACDIATPAPYVITEKTEDDGQFSWVIPTKLSDTYLGEVHIQVSEVDSEISGTSGAIKISKISTPDPASFHPVGSLLLGLDNIPSEGSLVVEVGDTTFRKIFPTGEVFISHGYKWEKFVAGNSADQNLPITSGFTYAPGSLIKSSDSQAVYLVSQGNTLRAFSSWNLFLQYGYTANMIWNVKSINPADYNYSTPITTLERHVDGTEVSYNGTVYYIGGAALHAYPTLEIYNSWHTYNNDFTRVVPANTMDMTLSKGAFQTTRYYPN